MLPPKYLLNVIQPVSSLASREAPPAAPDTRSVAPSRKALSLRAMGNDGSLLKVTYLGRFVREGLPRIDPDNIEAELEEIERDPTARVNLNF
ncbi:hypothetical protein EVAR_45724_1 [Eumeta japonica]|uniref:Uncharacterized protein n=1 Tax=Eumeta variegata TaxID=151549 RepID=A0A4C1WXL0_EUMVA|nr:hypothetical protein EVAR_45724_1 [Eumeta japonica]